MKQIIYKSSCLLILLLAFSINTFSTNLTSLSYYIDGNSSNTISIPLTPNAHIDTLISLVPTGLSQGLHQLSVYVEDENNNQSLIQNIAFYYIYSNSLSNDISKVEFTIDSLAPQVFTITPTSQLDQLFTLNTEGLSVGMHMLKVAVYGNDEIPSLNNYITFLMHSGNEFTNQISSFEVTIDNDKNNKQVINITPSPTFNDEITIHLDDISQGMHLLNIESVAQNGLRSLSNVGTFMKLNGTNSDSIVALEYYFDTDPGFGNGTRINTHHSQQIDTTFSIILPNNMSLGTHQLFIRAQTNAGEWSLSQIKSLKVCSIFPPEAGFLTARFGNDFSFIDTSKYASSWLWDFGDNTKDSIRFPIHNYQPGVYPIQQIVSNACSTDTISYNLTVEGIEKITPNRSAPTYINIVAYGGGFNANTKLRLYNDTYSVEPDTIIYNEIGNQLVAGYNLNEAPVGNYNVEFIINGNTFLSPDAYIIEEHIDDIVEVKLVGPSVVRINRWTDYKIEFNNKSNSSVYMLPFCIYIPRENEYRILDSVLFIPDTLHFENYLDSIQVHSSYFNVGTLQGYSDTGRYYFYHLGEIGPYENKSINIQLKLKDLSNIIVWSFPNEAIDYTDSSYANLRARRDSIGGGSGNAPNGPCIAAKAALLTSLAKTGADLVTGTSCVRASVSAVAGFFRAGAAIARSSNPSNFSVFTTAVVTPVFGLVGVGVECLKDAFNVNPIVKAIRTAYNLYNLYDDYKEYKELCDPEEDDKNIRAVNSLDPNAIYGPYGYNGVYINNRNTLNYQINFENVDTADVAAQYVTVKNWIDSNIFDLSTFKLNQIGIGGTVLKIPLDRQEFFSTIDLEDTTKALRINCTLDTVNSEIQLRFVTLDKSTGDLTTDPLYGFLPPNINQPEGEGWISYSIALKNGLPTNTPINNQAEIIFDENEPIFTNIWKNKIDNDAPQSSIMSATIMNDSTAQLILSKQDIHSNVRKYKLYQSINHQEFEYIRDVINNDTTYITHLHLDSTYSYYVIAHDSVGNKEYKEPSAEATIFLATLINENIHKNIISLYPNPTNGLINGKFNYVLNGKLEYYVTTIEGKNVQQQILPNSQNFTIDLSQYPIGMYFIQIRHNGTLLETKKIIKQ
ncbi:MAG: T9SS type A sorting domain-containing protein [Chitinophagales bacterium]|nr:T9SS type A sorting domain-containing protein [Chitinophagales bacterium]MCZ2394731.1 T9SS type A sorting domain-containing protein [Chitinophagales bacterium]